VTVRERQLDTVVKDSDGFVRLGKVVLFRVLPTPGGPVVHIRLKSNCRQVQERGSPDYYIAWEEFKAEIERNGSGIH